MTKEKYEDSVKCLDDDIKSAIDSLAKKFNFLGKDLVSFKDLSTRDGFSYVDYVLDGKSSQIENLVSEYLMNMENEAKENDEMFIQKIDM